VIGLLGLSRDITKLKEFEEALQKANTLLEQRVEERTQDLTKANQKMEEHIAQLNFLNTSFHSLSTIIQLSDLLRALLNIFLMRFPQSQGSISMKSRDGISCVNATTQLNSDAGKAATLQMIRSLVPDDMEQPLILDAWYKDDRVRNIKFQIDITLASCIIIPLRVDKNTVVLIQLFTLPDYAEHYRLNRPVFSALESHAALCLSNAVKYNELAQKSRLDGELDAARSIQRRFTPDAKPAIPHINIASIYTPANEVGGDYLDYFPTEQGLWVVVIADVCGKGVPAALLMTMIRSTFRVEAKHETSAKNLMCAVNDFMATNLDERSFVTALCLIIDPKTRTMTYARAGHPHLLKVGAKGEVPENVECNGMALGLIQDFATFNEMTQEVKIGLKSGERYVIYTDGVTESVNLSKNDYGLNRLQDLLAVNRTASADSLITLVMDDIKNFTNGASQHDDLTLLAFDIS
jgi:serine phosphatase RsbU (regulator of sigma subunit)